MRISRVHDSFCQIFLKITENMAGIERISLKRPFGKQLLSCQDIRRISVKKMRKARILH